MAYSYAGGARTMRAVQHEAPSAHDMGPTRLLGKRLAAEAQRIRGSLRLKFSVGPLNPKP